MLGAAAAGDSRGAALAALAQRLDPLTREVERLARLNVPNRLYAYCFCEVR
jgi:hypothetical protein